MLIGWLAPTRELYLLTLEITTLLAGRLTPAASVGVAARSLILPFLNSVSTVCLQFGLRPA